MSEAPAAVDAATDVPELPADFNGDGVRSALAGVMMRLDGRSVPACDVLNLAQCRPGAPSGARNPGQTGCQGRGFYVSRGREQRNAKLTLCGCASSAWRAANRRAVPILAEEGAEETDEGRRVPRGARERLAKLESELGRETAKLTAMRERVGTAIAGYADDLTTLTAEEAMNRRDSMAAAAMKKLAGQQLEELRARLPGLQTQIEEATATGEMLANQASHFGARRMELDAKIVSERKRLAPAEKESADRVESLDYRRRQHLARWPELAEVATS